MTTHKINTSMNIDTILMPDYPTFTYDGVSGKVEKKIFSTLKDAEEYVDSLNQQWFTHWIFPVWNIDTIGIHEFTYENPEWPGTTTEFVLYVGCITI